MTGEIGDTQLEVSFLPPVYLEQASIDAELSPEHSAVKLLAIARFERDVKIAELEEAQKDPLTGAWGRGPGFRKLEAMISLIENVQAGLHDDNPDLPNSVMGIGIDIEAMHHTNTWYGQKGGDARVIHAGEELREVAHAVSGVLRSSDRRSKPREEQSSRLEDILIRTGGDELMIAMAVNVTTDRTEEDIAKLVLQRVSDKKNNIIPDQRILYATGFYRPGQTPEEFYHSIDPKARMGRTYKLARPLFKVVRLGLGQYRPPYLGEL
jgi:hypothetical protein